MSRKRSTYTRSHAQHRASGFRILWDNVILYTIILSGIAFGIYAYAINLGR